MSENTKKIKECEHCGGDLAIRNPKGFCDHLYYPDNCNICKSHKPQEEKKCEHILKNGSRWCNHGFIISGKLEPSNKPQEVKGFICSDKYGCEDVESSPDKMVEEESWEEEFEKQFCHSLSWKTDESEPNELRLNGSMIIEIAKTKGWHDITEENITNVKNLKSFIAKTLSQALETRNKELVEEIGKMKDEAFSEFGSLTLNPVEKDIAYNKFKTLDSIITLLQSK